MWQVGLVLESGRYVTRAVPVKHLGRLGNAGGGAEERRSLKFELGELDDLNKSLNRDSPSLRQSG